MPTRIWAAFFVADSGAGIVIVPTIKLGAVEVLALGGLGIGVGVWLKKRMPILDRLCIPTSIVGGMIFALAALALHDRVVNFEPDTVLRDLLMIAFMTTIGLSARVELIRRGSVQVVLLLTVASVGAVLQNLLGIGLAKLFHLNPLVGIISGSVALTGGPATALAFGSTFEKMGVTGAAEMGLAAATFGIAVSGLVAGYIGGRLIQRNKLAPNLSASSEKVAENVGEVKLAAAISEQRLGENALLYTVALIGVSMGVGSLISTGLQRMGFILPSYIGAMIAASIIRNANDKFKLIRISQQSINDCAVIALYLFIVMAVLTLRLWELAHLALPMLVMLCAQVVLCWLMCVTICFYTMGRDYRAAVISSGFCGFMLGITANAIACMQELVEKFGAAPEAFLVVPVVGAFLIDMVNSLVITFMANIVK
jgi:glutamate:Na+ symporter, ESS family